MNLEEIIENLSGNKFQSKFLEQRKVFLWGPVHDESAKKIVNQLLYLDALDSKKEITLYISSPGGVVISGMVIVDAMKMISSPVRTVCMGMSASMGAIILSQGEKGKREIWPSGRVMIHQPSIGGAYGQASDLEITARQMQKTKEESAQLLADATGKSFDQIMKDFDRDYWLDAQESLDYGIVDKITKKI